MTYNSQIGQDAWVESVLGPKKNGYFVELGACDGIYYSNTLYFEKRYNWAGLCIEPNDVYFEKLVQTRNCSVSNELVSSEEGHVVDFLMCESTSGISDTAGPFTKSDKVVKKRTTTLGALLDKYKAPSVIDYLSLDVEGHEYEILSTFPYEKYKFRTLTVEHNAPHVGPVEQNRIRALLESKGYKYIRGNPDTHNWCHGPIDDFYVWGT